MSLIPIPPGMTADQGSEFSLQGLMQNANAYAEASLTIATSGTNITLTPAQVLAKNLVLSPGASGPFTVTLPATSKIIDALGRTMPRDGSFYFPLYIWNLGTGQTATLTAGDASTTISGDATVADSTGAKWMFRLATPKTLSVLRVFSSGGSGAAGNPAPPNTSVQFNNSGVFGGDSTFTYDSTGKIVSVNEAKLGNFPDHLEVTSGNISQWLDANETTLDSLSLSASDYAFNVAAHTPIILQSDGTTVVGGTLSLANSSNANLTSFKAGVATASVTYTLPTADGSANYVLKTNGAGTLSWANVAGLAVNGWFSITYASTITPDLNNSPKQKVTLTGPVTIANPVNMVDGSELWLRLTQDASGNRVASWGSKFKFFGAGSKTLTTAGNAVDMAACTYDLATDLWYCNLVTNAL